MRNEHQNGGLNWNHPMANFFTIIKKHLKWYFRILFYTIGIMVMDYPNFTIIYKSFNHISSILEHF